MPSQRRLKVRVIRKKGTILKCGCTMDYLTYLKAIKEGHAYGGNHFPVICMKCKNRTMAQASHIMPV
jgi:hypothetical protein